MDGNIFAPQAGAVQSARLRAEIPDAENCFRNRLGRLADFQWSGVLPRAENDPFLQSRSGIAVKQLYREITRAKRIKAPVFQTSSASSHHRPERTLRTRTAKADRRGKGLETADYARRNQPQPSPICASRQSAEMARWQSP